MLNNFKKENIMVQNKKTRPQGFLKKAYASLTSETAKQIYAKIPLIISLIFALLAVLQIIYYILGPAEGYFHADCTDSIYWAQASVDGGAVFNPDFYYAALLPFSASVWFIPLIHIFGVTMTAHNIGMVIFAVLFFASVIFFCRSMDWRWEYSLLSAGALMLMLSSSDKMREIMWGHVIYYSLGLLILFTGTALFFCMSKSFRAGKTRRAWIYAAVFFVFMLLSATNGFQCIAIYTLPMLAAMLAEMIFNSKEKLISRHNAHSLLGAALLVFATLLGLALLSVWKGNIIAGYAEAYSMLDNIANWVDNLLKFPESYFSLFGISIEDGAAVGTKETIFNLIKLASSLIVLFLPTVLLFCYKKIEDKETKIVAWIHFVVSAVILFGFICGRLSAGNWRLIPMTGTGILASLAAIRFMFKARENIFSWRRVGALLAVFPVLCSLVNYKAIADMPEDYGRDNALHQLAEFLEEKELTYGYAEFWTAQATTLISDSNVKVRGVTISHRDGVDPYLYQSNRLWYEDQEGAENYFLVLSAYEYNQIFTSNEWKIITANHLVDRYDCAGYLIFVFDCNIFPAIYPAEPAT